MAKDITGIKYGRLTAIKFSHRIFKGNSYWYFKCDCGNEILRPVGAVRSGYTKSCGCIRNKAPNVRLRNIYIGMKSRCYNSKIVCYKRYGGRGIGICEEWLQDINKFYSWSMLNGYNDRLTIDRINNDGNYEPNNCRWTTAKINSNNKSNTIYIVHEGLRLTISGWSEKTGIPQKLIRSRYLNGFPTKSLFIKSHISRNRSIKVIATNIITGGKSTFKSRSDASKALGLNICAVVPGKSNRKIKCGYIFELFPKKPKKHIKPPSEPIPLPNPKKK